MKSVERVEMLKISRMLGEVSISQLKNTDRYISDKIIAFMPIIDFCEHAVGSLHCHPSYQMFLVFNKQLSFETPEREYKTIRNKMLLIPPETMHREIAKDSFVSYITLFVDKEYFDEQLKLYNCHEGISEISYIQITPNIFPIVKDFMVEVKGKLPGSDQLEEAISLKIVHSIIRNMLGVDVHEGEIFKRMEINRAIEYMNSNMKNKITVYDLAEVTNMSPSHLNRLFKKETGQSCISYLNSIRLERVKTLLLEGGRTVTEIAMECGFSSPAYLSASFSAKFNMAPKEYQNIFEDGRISKE